MNRNNMAKFDCTDCISYSVWNSLIKQHLGKKARRHVLGIIHNIVAVDRGIKRAYLLDFGIDCINLVHLLKDLLKSNCINRNLNVYQIEMDVLIVNPNCIECLQQESELESNFIINVSASLGKPEIICSASIIHDIHQFVLKLPFDIESVLKYDINAYGINMTTLFGVILGYPFIYWFNTESDQHCLDMEPLRCFEVRWTLDIKDILDSSDKTHSIFSFSVPELLWQQELKLQLEKWFMLKQKVDNHIQLSSKTVVLPVVAL